MHSWAVQFAFALPYLLSTAPKRLKTTKDARTYFIAFWGDLDALGVALSINAVTAARIGAGKIGQKSINRFRFGSISVLLLILLRAPEGSCSEVPIFSGFSRSLSGLIIPWLLVRIQSGPLN